MAHKMFGKLPWKDLFEPSAQIAQDGFEISSSLAHAIQSKKNIIIEGNYTALQ